MRTPLCTFGLYRRYEQKVEEQLGAAYAVYLESGRERVGERGGAAAIVAAMIVRLTYIVLVFKTFI